MELTPKDTKMLQGLSVLAMVCLHLFDRYDYDGLFQPLVFLAGYPLSFYFGQISDFCVVGFAFCSGYSHMAMLRTMDRKQYVKRSWQRLAYLYINYWIVLFVFTALSIIGGQRTQMPGLLMKFAGHFVGLLHTYNESWWYLFTYVLLVVLSPLIIRQINKRGSFVCLGVSFGIYLAAYYVRYMSGLSSWFAIQFGKFGMTLFEYIIGAAFCKDAVFTKLRVLSEQVKEKIGTVTYHLSWCVVLGMIFVGRTLLVPNMIAAPFSGIVIIVWFCLMQKPDWVERLFLWGAFD